MSNLRDYDEYCKTYDNVRFADGANVMSYMVKGMLKMDPSKIHMLEAGCGTGNYSLALIENGIGKLTLLDASAGMLEKAKSKLSKYKDRVVEVRQHLLPHIPFAVETFDACTFIQVLHHLDVSKEEKNVYNYINAEKAIVEAYRVLKPSGVLVIDHFFRQNIDAFFSPSLAPKANAYLRQVYMDEEDLIYMLRKKGFGNISYVSQPGSYSSKGYLEIENLLNPNWRKSDCLWQILEESGELDFLLKLLQKHKDEASLTHFAHDFYQLNRKVGEHTMLFAQKL